MYASMPVSEPVWRTGFAERLKLFLRIPESLGVMSVGQLFILKNKNKKKKQSLA